MGQKIHPIGFRLAVNKNWGSRWFANSRNFAGMLAEDLQVRDYLKTRLKSAAVSRILIERPAKNARITIFSARPGVVIGKTGEDIHIFGRITALADVFDALGTERPYKEAWSIDRILEFLRTERGRHFDPRLVDVIFENLDELLDISRDC